MKHIIVGIDPGKTAAIACIDLEGRALHIESARFAGFNWFVDKIKEVGIPVLIASDKKNSTAAIDKIGAAFGARIFSPEQDISVTNKEMITSKFSFSNIHERDALSAALTAYKAYSRKFNQAERLAREKSFDDIDKLKSMIVKKYSMHETMENKKAGKRK